MGRGLDSDVVVEDGACSRQHAQITVAQTTDSAFLEDLGSRNGTFLNGELVTSKVRVHDGGRLQLGASVFLFRLTDDTRDIELAETGTLTFASSGGYRQDMDGGDLTKCGTLELLRGLFNSKRSVTVHVAVPGEHAILDVREGELLFADYAGLEGFNALVKLARAPTGIFWLVETDEGCDRNITQSMLHLMSDLQRCLGPEAAPLG